MSKRFTLADQTIISGSNFILFVFLSRILTKYELASFAVLWTIMLIIQSFQISIVLTPMLSLSKKDLPLKIQTSYYSSILKLQLIFSFISTILVLLISLINLNPEISIDFYLIIKFIPTIIGLQFCEFIRRYYYSNLFFKKVFTYDLFRLFIQNFLLILLIILSNEGIKNINSVFLIFDISIFASIFYFRYQNSGLYKVFKFKKLINFPLDEEHLRLSKSLIPSSLMQWTGGGLYSLLAGTMLGPTSLLAIKIIQNIVGLGNIIFQSIENTFITKLSLIYKESKYKKSIFINYANKLLLLTFILFLSIYVPIFLFSKPIIGIIYGVNYQNYDWLLQIFSVVYIFNAISICLKTFSISTKDIKIINIVYMVTNITSIFFGYFLIKNYALKGAGYGILITQLINTSIFFAWWILKSKKKV